MQLCPSSRGYIFGFASCVVRSFSHPSSRSENVAFARRVMQLQQVVEMPYCFKFVYLKIIRGKIFKQSHRGQFSKVKGFKVSSAGGSHLVYEFYKIVVVVAFVGYLSSCRSLRWEKKKTSARGVGDLSILLEAVNIIPLSIFHIMCIFISLFRQLQIFLIYRLSQG